MHPRSGQNASTEKKINLIHWMKHCLKSSSFILLLKDIFWKLSNFRQFVRQCFMDRQADSGSVSCLLDAKLWLWIGTLSFQFYRGSNNWKRSNWIKCPIREEHTVDVAREVCSKQFKQYDQKSNKDSAEKHSKLQEESDKEQTNKLTKMYAVNKDISELKLPNPKKENVSANCEPEEEPSNVSQISPHI